MGIARNLRVFAVTRAATAAPTSAAAAQLETVTPGKLTIATGEPAYEPWVLNDDPAETRRRAQRAAEIRTLREPGRAAGVV